mmetsp:Transcript_12440/g.43935  ORF Transcript_12440/g.43935 Transcript_12440/m.43935 type:complete len:219 (+) Transcript_12440:168-824(+)
MFGSNTLRHSLLAPLDKTRQIFGHRPWRHTNWHSHTEQAFTRFYREPSCSLILQALRRFAGVRHARIPEHEVSGLEGHHHRLAVHVVIRGHDLVRRRSWASFRWPPGTSTNPPVLSASAGVNATKPCTRSLLGSLTMFWSKCNQALHVRQVSGMVGGFCRQGLQRIRASMEVSRSVVFQSRSKALRTLGAARTRQAAIVWLAPHVATTPVLPPSEVLS